MGSLFLRAVMSEACKLEGQGRLLEPWHLRVRGIIDWAVPFQGSQLLSPLKRNFFSGRESSVHIPGFHVMILMKVGFAWLWMGVRSSLVVGKPGNVLVHQLSLHWTSIAGVCLGTWLDVLSKFLDHMCTAMYECLPCTDE